MTSDLTDASTPPPDAVERRALTPHAPLRHAVVLVNPLSGSVGPRAAAEVEAIMADYDLKAQVITLEGGGFDEAIAEAFAAKPDVIFVLAGDGTARSVASKARPDGPMIAPLPGGTMNMLPKALYGTADWKLALKRALEEGEAQPVSGGEVQGEYFYCAAILGSPALWAPAREAMRTGKIKLAWQYGRRALKRAFSGRLRFTLDGGEKRRTEALVLISPMISKAMEDPIGLEAAAMDPSDTTQAFRLAATALFSDWRQDPAVSTRPAKLIEVRARSKIPAVIDGEPLLLKPDAVIRFVPKAFKALAPKPPSAEDKHLMGRVLQFSDVHFGCEHKHACAAALDYAHATPNDLVLITGDITQKGYPDEFTAAGEWMRAMPEPRFVIVGNHDVPYWDAVARVLHPWRAFETATGFPAHDGQFRSDAVMVRGVVTARGWQARPNWSKGVIDLDQTRRAAEALRQAPIGALRILACHHPLIEMVGTPMTGDVKRGDEAALIFAEAGVDLIMTGHVHVPFAMPIPLADHCSYAVGCGTLSHRERGAPPGFNQIDWDAKTITVTALAWDGTSYRSHQVWRLPRRQDTRKAATAPSPVEPGALEKAAV